MWFELKPPNYNQEALPLVSVHPFVPIKFSEKYKLGSSSFPNFSSL